MNLKDKIILITGGSSGLGFSIVKSLLNKGAKVITTGTSEKSIQRLNDISSSSLTTHILDIRDHSSITNMIGKIDRVDIVINNAGMWFDGSVGELDDQKISDTIDINLKGPIILANQILPKLVESKGFLINISSSAGLVGRAGESVYAASKFGLRGFTDALRQEVIGTGVRVVGIYPGGMNTPFYERKQVDRDVSTWMDTKDVAQTIIHLLENSDTLTMDHIVLNRKK